MSTQDFQNARKATESMYKARPEDSVEPSNPRSQEERLTRQKEELYNKSMEAFRAEDLRGALREAEELVKLCQPDKKEDATYGAFYNQVKSLYETLSRKYDEAQRLSDEKRFTEAIALCNEVLAQYPNNRPFQALRDDIEDKRRQERSSYVAGVLNAADSEQDLDRKIHMLEYGLKRCPKEPSLIQALKIAKEKKESAKSSLQKALVHEAAGDFSKTLTPLETPGTMDANRPGLDSEADPLKKSLDRSSRLEEKARLIETINRTLFDERFENALKLVDSALQAFPEDPDFEELKKEAEQGVGHTRGVETLINQAHQCLQNQEYEKAITSLKEASELDPWNAQVKPLQVQSMIALAKRLRSTDLKAAEKLLRRVLSIDKDNEQTKDLLLEVMDERRQAFVDRVLARAQELHRKGQLERAARVLSDGLKRYPEEIRISQSLAVVEKLQAESKYHRIAQQIERRVRDLITDRRYQEAEDLVEEHLPTYAHHPQLTDLLAYVREARNEEYKNQAAEDIGQRNLRPALNLTNKASGPDPEINRPLTRRNQIANRPRVVSGMVAGFVGLAALLAFALLGYKIYVYKTRPPMKPELSSTASLAKRGGGHERSTEAGSRPDALRLPESKLEDNPQPLNGELADVKNQLAKLDPAERETEKELSLLEKIKTIDPKDNETTSRMESLLGKVEDLKKQISDAINSNKLLPPGQDTAWRLNKQLKRKMPTRESDQYQRNREAIRSGVVVIAKQKCATPNEECKNYVLHALIFFMSDPNLRKLKEQVAPAASQTPPPSEEDLADEIKKLLSDARAHRDTGEYVLPENDNAVYYALEVLKLDSSNREARQIKSESCRAARKEISQLRRLNQATTKEDRKEDSDQVRAMRAAIGSLCYGKRSLRIR